MKYIDSWGNEYSTEKAAKEGILRMLKNTDNYYRMLSDEMNIPWVFFEWILKDETRKLQFGFDFCYLIKKIEKRLVDDYWLDVDEIEEQAVTPVFLLSQISYN